MLTVSPTVAYNILSAVRGPFSSTLRIVVISGSLAGSVSVPRSTALSNDRLPRVAAMILLLACSVWRVFVHSYKRMLVCSKWLRTSVPMIGIDLKGKSQNLSLFAWLRYLQAPVSMSSFFSSLYVSLHCFKITYC